jgi:hypothetical protein
MFWWLNPIGSMHNRASNFGKNSIEGIPKKRLSISATTPPITTQNTSKNGWLKTLGAAIFLYTPQI